MNRFRDLYSEEKYNIHKLILITSDKTKKLELKKQLEKDETTEFVTSCLRNPEEFVDLLDDIILWMNILKSFEGRALSPLELFIQ